MHRLSSWIRTAALLSTIAAGAIGIAALPASGHPSSGMFRAAHALGHLRIMHLGGGSHAMRMHFEGSHRNGAGHDWGGWRHHEFRRDAEFGRYRNFEWRHGHDWRHEGGDRRHEGWRHARGGRSHGWRDGFGRWHWAEGAASLFSGLGEGEDYDGGYSGGGGFSDEGGYAENDGGYGDQDRTYGYEDRAGSYEDRDGNYDEGSVRGDRDNYARGADRGYCPCRGNESYSGGAGE